MANIEKIELKQDIIEILNKCQSTTAVHQRNSIILKQLYESSKHEEFWSYLQNILKIVLVNEQQKNRRVEKLINFIGLFCSLLRPIIPKDQDESVEYQEHPLFLDTVHFLLETSQLERDIIRIRSCQLINVILEKLVGAEISEELGEKLEEVLLQRLQDPKSVVRQHAVMTLYRLQDPTNPENPIIKEFTNLMNSDNMAKVRLVCVEKIAIRNDVLPHLLMRIRDVDQHVRLAAFKRFSDCASNLKIFERQLILHCGFLDKSEQIRQYISSGLIKAWLESYNQDILKLMKSLRLDADEKDIANSIEIFEKVLKILFEYVPFETLTSTLLLNEERLVPYEKLNWEMVSFWRIYVQFLSQRNDLEDEFEKVVPELIYFSKYIKGFYMDIPKEVTSEEFIQNQFILKQLFLMTKTFDFGDITNRNCLNSLVSDILEKAVLISDVTEIIVSVLVHSIPNINQLTQFGCEIISGILKPIETVEEVQMKQEREFQMSRIIVEQNRIKDQQEEAIQNENFIEAERLKKELEDLKNELLKIKNAPIEQPLQLDKQVNPLITIKCLDITAGLFLCPKMETLTPSLKALKENFFQDLLIHENDIIRVRALKCYGLYCIYDKETAATGIHIFSTPIFAYRQGEECDTQTLIICISAVVDILRIYGPQLIAAPESGQLSESLEENQQAVFAGGTSLTDILQGLVDLMDDDQSDIQEKAGLGLCQLVISNRIVSPSLIARLIIRWCNPASESDCNRLKPIIGFTMEKIPHLRDCTDQLIDAIFITLQALYAAPRISPLADVNVENIAKFLLALCRVSPKADYINSKIAIRLLKDINEVPRNKMNVLYSKMLLILEIPDNHTSIEELLNYCNDILEIVRERSVITNVNKFVKKLHLKALNFDKTKLDVIEEAKNTTEDNENVEKVDGNVKLEIIEEHDSAFEEEE